MDKTELMKELEEMGYGNVRELPTGEIAATLTQIYTTGLCVGLDEFSMKRRYCYEHRSDAEAALAAWNGTGDPSGPWIKEKPSERLGPGARDG